MDIQVAHPPGTGLKRIGRRKQFIVDSAFQWKYTLAIAIGVFLVASVMGIAMFGYMHQQARHGTLLGRTIDPWQNTKTILLFATLFSSITVTGLIAWGIVVTHRVCGPVYVLKQHLTVLRDGRFPRYRPLRKRDELKDLHSFFFETVDVLRKRAEDARTGLDEVLADLNRSATSDEKQRKQAIEAACKAVTTLRDRAAESLEHPRSAKPASAPPPTPREPARHKESSREVATARS